MNRRQRVRAVIFRAWALAVVSTAIEAQPIRPDLAQGPPSALVRVEHPGARGLRVAPGERLTTLFKVSNAALGDVALQPRVRHPASWQLITPEPPYTVAAGATELRVISVAVPRGAAPEERWLIYEAGGGAEAARDSVRVSITAQSRLSVAVMEMPPIASTNRAYRATFVVRNTGNVRLVARGRVVGPLIGVAHADTAAWVLEPGSARTLVLDIAPRTAVQLRGLYYLGIQAASVNDSSVSGRAGSVVEFLARGEDPAVPGRELPATLALRYAPKSREAERAALDFVAQGPLDRDSSTALHLVVRTPGPQSSPLFEQDEYRLSLRMPHLLLRAGDQFFEQSPLTEAGRLTFGAGATLATGRLSTTVFDLTSRWHFDDGRSRGATVGVRLGDSTSLRLNALSHQGDDAGRVLSIGASSIPAAGTRFGVELGRGRAVSGAVASGVAWQAQMLRPSWDIGWRGHATQDAYPARNGYGDHHDGSASAALAPSLRLRLSTTRREFERTAAGVQHALNTDVRSVAAHVGALGSLEWREQDLASRLGTAALDESERAARLLLHGNVRALQVSSVLERGSVEARPQNVRRDFTRASLRTGVRGSQASLALFADYTDRSAAAGNVAQRWLSAGVVAGAGFGRTQLVLTALNARDGMFARVRFTMIDARIDRAVRRAGRLSLRYRSLTFGPYTAGRESYMAVEYATAFGIPLGGMRTRGRLHATVIDRETGRGVADAIVAVANERFLTDDAGRVILDRLMPGTYALAATPSAATTQPAGTAAADGPSAVRIRAAETERIEFGLARGARLTGRVVFATAPEPGIRAATDTGQVGMANVLVTAATESDTVRQLSDADGAFSFAGLAAGRWTISVLQLDAPANYRFAEPTLAVTLAPGQVSRVTLVALPVPRGIRWREGGELIELRPPPASIVKSGKPH